MSAQSKPTGGRQSGDRGILPLALFLTLTLGLVEPAAARVAPREPVRASLWSVALSRAVEALAEAGECQAIPEVPSIACEPSGQVEAEHAQPAVTDLQIAARGEGDLPPPMVA